jgi:protein phosphatase PTC1
MSNIFNQNAYQNYHYRQQRDNPRKVLGTTFDPYQPKISSQVTQEKYIQSLGSTLQRGITPQKPYENNSYKNGRRSSSTAPLINNSYNIINNNPYSRSPNYNTYVNGYTHNRDHVKDLLNLTGKDTLTNFKENNKQGYNNNYTINNLKTINTNYEVAKNNYQDYNRTIDNNNNKYMNKDYNNYNSYNNNYTPKKIIEEKISNDILDSYYVENNSSLIKDLAYKENANSRYRDYMEDKGKSILNFNSSENNALICLFDGHGGQEVSKFLQENIAKFWLEILPLNQDNYGNKIKNVFLNLDQKLKENHFYQVGSTGCIVYLTIENSQKILYCANVGDTRAVLIKNNKGVRLTYDDRASDPKEHERIVSHGGIVFGGRVYGQLMLSRAFGDWELKTYGVICEPHIIRYEIEDEDNYLVIATDGVFDVMEDEDVFQLSKKQKNAKDFCDDIMKEAIERGSMDNISCFIIGLK